MIIDQIKAAGIDSYFQDPSTAGITNLGPLAPVRVRTVPLTKGKQANISGLRILLEATNLSNLFPFQVDSANANAPAPFFKITVMKEMFPGLFADPFRHRVYNIAGFIDFNEGKFENCRAMEIEGIPTIVSLGNKKCTWTSKKYELPNEISVSSIAWELASSILTSNDSYNYSLDFSFWDITDSLITVLQIGQNGTLTPNTNRAVEGLLVDNIKYVQVKFSAFVLYDSFIKERHVPVIIESLGTPLLRAINILEPVDSIYDFNSLNELEEQSGDFRIFNTPGPEISRLTSHINLSAVLVNSPTQIIGNDIYDANSKYEFIEIELSTQFSTAEFQLVAEYLLKE